MRSTKGTRLNGVAIAAAVMIAMGLVACATVPPSTPSFVGNDGLEISGSISTVETLVLGGVEQTITIRGVDASNPVLLHLHGGPGMPSAPWASWRNSYKVLEQNFVLVHWDQRGAGHSYHPDLTPEDMHIESLVSDTLELTDYLRKRFGVQKILLWGHSWGSGLGFEVLRADSTPFAAFFASGVRPSWNSTQAAGYEMVLNLARERGDDEAVAELTAIQPFDPTNRDHINLRAKYLSQFLVGDFHTEGLETAWLDYAGTGRSPEYPPQTVGNVIAGLGFTRQTIGAEIVDSGFDLYRDFAVSTIPVHFFAERYDYETPGDLAYHYYEALVAPQKSFTWLENSAHNIMYDEPEAFGRALVEIANRTDTSAN